jgi:hypothetical protein
MKSYIDIAADNGISEKAIKAAFAVGMAMVFIGSKHEDTLKAAWNCCHDLELLDALQNLAGVDGVLSDRLAYVLTLMDKEHIDAPTCC